jgi:hypothetical protein
MPPKSRLPSSEGFSLKYVLNVVDEILYLHLVAESVEEASLD